MPRKVLPRPHEMGRMKVPVRVTHVADGRSTAEFEALIDTGASHLTLPTAWKDRFPGIKVARSSEAETATGASVAVEICGPVAIEVGDFDPIYSEVMFLDMTPNETGDYEPLLGHLPLQSIPVTIDLKRDRLVKVTADVK